jgi:hypothetical protein
MLGRERSRKSAKCIAQEITEDLRLLAKVPVSRRLSSLLSRALGHTSVLGMKYGRW